MQSIYNTISTAFDKSRHAKWSGVVNFLNTLPENSKILDVGCGNGKYLNIRPDCKYYACDISEKLIEIAKKKNPSTQFCQIECASKLPYPNGSFDAVICVAVLHHIKSRSARERAIMELRRVVKPDGMVLVTFWSTEAIKDTWVDLGHSNYYVPWKSNKEDVQMRFYHITNQYEALNLKTLYDFDILSFEHNNWYLIKS